MTAPWHKALLTPDPVRPEVMTQAEVRRMYRTTIRQGGVTWEPGRGPWNPGSGYGMSAKPGTFRRVRVTDERAFRRAVWYLRRSWKGLIGTWVEDGYIHLDPAIVVGGTVEDAAAKARSLGQLAFYSFADGRTIEVN